MVSSPVPQDASRTVPRVRPHVTSVARRAQCLVLDFDGLVCDVPRQPQQGAVERTLWELMCGEWWAPRSILAGLGPWPETLGYLAAQEPDTFRLAEPECTARAQRSRVTADKEINAPLPNRRDPKRATRDGQQPQGRHER
jgi:hypothetical protein